ncbi:MAG: twin-arginine translocase subunit TatC [Acidimicrobiales bacterium]|jgi:sec-independent protein translocase protein TatC
MAPSEQTPEGTGGEGVRVEELDGLGGAADLGLGDGNTAPYGTDGAATVGATHSQEEELDGDGARMTLWEHLAELRRRLIISASALLLAVIAGYFLYDPVLTFMKGPYGAYCHSHPHTCVTSNLIITGPAEGFLTRLKVAMYIGVALAAPVWLWQLWRFITPGLKKREKRYAIPFVASAIGLFAMGVTVAILVWPKAVNWLVGASGTGVSPLFNVGEYISLYVLICLVFGLVFLYPTIVVGLMLARVIPSAKWRKWRRPAIVVLCAVAAIVTPSNDPFTFLGMAVPMVIFYEASILVGRLLHR